MMNSYYADIALGIRIGGQETILTYEIPPNLLHKLTPGVIVQIPFRSRTAEGVMVGFRKQLPTKSFASRLKPILRVLSEFPILGNRELILRSKLAKQLGQPAGLVLNTILPPHSLLKQLSSPADELILKPEKKQFWLSAGGIPTPAEIDQIQPCLILKQTVLVLTPNRASLKIWDDFLRQNLGDQLVIRFDLLESVAEQNDSWRVALNGEAKVLVGMRSASLLPFRRLGLIIIDQPSHSQFFEEQAPYYHAFQIAQLRALLFGTKLIAKESLPPFEILKKPERTSWQFDARLSSRPNIEISLRKPSERLLPATREKIEAALSQDKRIFFWVSRRGWAAGMLCNACHKVVTCPNCERTPLVSDLLGRLDCLFCKKNVSLPARCSSCKNNQFKTFGWGADRWAEYLKDTFSQKSQRDQIQIMVANLSSLPTAKAQVSVLIEPEKWQSARDFRSHERWLRTLWEIRNRTTETVLIETGHDQHSVFRELPKILPTQSISAELTSRKQHQFPPFGSGLILTFGVPSVQKAILVADKIQSVINGWPGRHELIGPNQVDEHQLLNWEVLVKLNHSPQLNQIRTLKKPLPRKHRVIFL